MSLSHYLTPATAAFAAWTADDPIIVPKLRVILASVAGSTSLACWIVLLLPQLIEQWKTQSADGISIGFLLIWLLGDVTNLSGAIWGDLLPEVILLAAWYCVADSLILFSYFYYKRLSQLKKNKLKNYSHNGHNNNNGDDFVDENAPLLNRRNSVVFTENARPELDHEDPGFADHHHEHHHHHNNHHNRRDSHSTRRRDSIVSNVSEIVDVDGTSVVKGIILPILFVFACGICGYLFSSNGATDVIIPPPSKTPDSPADKMSPGPQILGYLSAIFYLGARIPQILQNYHRKSVYGLSLLFFIFSVMGNLTYAAQILIYRQDKDWIVLNFPWILGSLGTIFEDGIIFLQFFKYGNNNSLSQ